MIFRIVNGNEVAQYYPSGTVVLSINPREGTFSFELHMLDDSRLSEVILSGRIANVVVNGMEKKMEVELG